MWKAFVQFDSRCDLKGRLLYGWSMVYPIVKGTEWLMRCPVGAQACPF